ncbi:hypothetical protein HDV63DRAFT_380516 [Trichoderma sp. SZMC 28014]
MGVQKTFTIIPPAGPATRTPVDSRPMTSKQVRKAYQAATRVPRLSKAERIKQERAEQERIRKEFEKEKAAARAKFLREKKKAKEEAEKQEKKKKGLPLVTVRPSQDTIAKFFRGNGLGHKRSCEGEDVGATKAPELPAVEELAEDDGDDDFPSPKRLCNEKEQGGKLDEGVERRGEHASLVPEEPYAEPRVMAEEKQDELIMEDDDDVFDGLDIPKHLFNAGEQDGEGGEKTEREKNMSPMPEEHYAKPCFIAKEKGADFVMEEDFLDGFEILSDEEMSRLSFNETVTHIGVDNRKEDAPQPHLKLDAMPVEKQKGHLHDKATNHQSIPIKPTKYPELGDSQEFDLIFGDQDDLELETQKSHLHDKVTNHQSSPTKSAKHPELGDSQEFELIFGDQDDLELEMLALDGITTFQQQPTKESIETPSPRSPQKLKRKTTAHELDLGLVADSNLDKETHEAKSQKELDQTSLMPPPPIPLAPRPSVSPISPVAAEPQAPPLSTQQILFNMDDFFPSSSQQAAELEEEVTLTSPMKSRLESQIRTPNPPRVIQKGSLPVGSLSSSPETPKPFFTASGSNERMAVALLRSRRTAEQEEERRRQTMQLELAEIEQARKKEAERRAREEMLTAGKLKPKNANHAAARTGRNEGHSNTASPARISQFSARKRLIMNDVRTPAKPTPQRTPLVEANPKAVTKSPTVANMSRKVLSLGSNIRLHNTNRMVQEARQQYPPKHANTPIIPVTKPKDVNTSLETSESKCPPASQESEFGGSWMDELATELSL